MSNSVYISSVLYYPPNLHRNHIRSICGELLNKKIAEVVWEEEIGLNNIPQNKVIKMTKKKYVDSFFEDGTLKLGNFSYYNQYDHDEIGDQAEGSFILVGQSHSRTVIAEIGSGFNHYIFCCYTGNPDSECMEKFGYDSGIIINNVKGFANAISKQIKAKSYLFAKCVYNRDKVLIGKNEKDFNEISARLKNLTNNGKYFIKPDKYSNQSEFRFTWKMDSDINTPKIIRCPEAIQFCERL